MKTRKECIDDQNQPVVYEIAKGGEPCRDVLRVASAGEKLILASYCPFSKVGPYKKYGAIFVLANHSDEVVNYEKLPLSTSPESNYFGGVIVLRAYDDEEYIYDARLVTPLNVEQNIKEIFEHTKVTFIHVRYAAYGCYGLRLDRQ